MVHGKDETHKSTLDYLSDYVMWLKYPEYRPNVVPFPNINEKDKKEIKPRRSNNTINQMMSCVYGFYDYLSVAEAYPELDIYRRNKFAIQDHSVLSEMKKKKEATYSSMIKLTPEEKKIKFITRKEFWQIYNACTCRRDRVICGLMFDGALRVSEVCGLHLKDFSGLQDGRVDIVLREDIANEDAAVKYGSEGYVVVPDYLKKEIIKYINEISNVDTNYFVFNMWGKTKYEPMKTDTIRDMVENTRKRSGITHEVTPHMFRHGIAVELADLIALSKNPKSEYYGMQFSDIKEKLRHSCLQSTEKYADYTFTGKKAISHQEHVNQGKEFTENGYDALAYSIRNKRRNKTWE